MFKRFKNQYFFLDKWPLNKNIENIYYLMNITLEIMVQSSFLRKGGWSGWSKAIQLQLELITSTIDFRCCKNVKWSVISIFVLVWLDRYMHWGGFASSYSRNCWKEDHCILWIGIYHLNSYHHFLFLLIALKWQIKAISFPPRHPIPPSVFCWKFCFSTFDVYYLILNMAYQF